MDKRTYAVCIKCHKNIKIGKMIDMIWTLVSRNTIFFIRYHKNNNKSHSWVYYSPASLCSCSLNILSQKLAKAK